MEEAGRLVGKLLQSTQIGDELKVAMRCVNIYCDIENRMTSELNFEV